MMQNRKLIVRLSEKLNA